MVELLIDLIGASVRWALQEAKIEFRGRLFIGGVITPFDWDFDEDEDNHAPYGQARLFMQYKRNGVWLSFLDHSEDFMYEKEGTEAYDKLVSIATSRIIIILTTAGVWQHLVATQAQERSTKKASPIITDLSSN